MTSSKGLPNELREGRGPHTGTLSKAGEEVVEVVEIDRRGVGVDGVASSIASILHHGPKQKGALGGALVEQEEVQQGGARMLKFEEVG